MSEKIKHVCSERIYRPYEFGVGNCLCKAAVFEDGKWWCKRHVPSVQRIKIDKRTARLRAQMEAWRIKSERTVVIEKLTEGLSTEVLARPAVRNALVNFVAFLEDEVKE